MESVSVGCLLVTRMPVKAVLLARPELAGRPFVVYGRDVRVLGASPEAAGARVGAPLSEALSAGAARSRWRPTMRRWRALRRIVLEALCGCEPGVEPADDGVFYLDVSGMARLAGSVESLAGRVLASCGVALRPRLGRAAGGGQVSGLGGFAGGAAGRLAGGAGGCGGVAVGQAGFAAAGRRGGVAAAVPARGAAVGGFEPDAVGGACRLSGAGCVPGFPSGTGRGCRAGGAGAVAGGIGAAGGVSLFGGFGGRAGVRAAGALRERSAGVRAAGGGSGACRRFGRRRLVASVPDAAVSGGFGGGSVALLVGGGAVAGRGRFWISRFRCPGFRRRPGFRVPSGIVPGVGRRCRPGYGVRRCWTMARGLLPERNWGLGPTLRPMALPRPVTVEGCRAPRRVCLGRWRSAGRWTGGGRIRCAAPTERGAGGRADGHVVSRFC